MNELYRRLAEENRGVKVSPGLKASLLKEFRRRRVRQALPPALFAIAACFAAALWLMPKPHAEEAQFERIPYAAPLAPYERAEVVRVEMPVSAFAAAGIQIVTSDAGAKARADLVVGEDGMARAFRILSVSSNE
jgi:hypothetical protein